MKFIKHLYQYKNWEFFLLLFIIPSLLIIYISLLTGLTGFGFILSSALYLIWYAILAFWLFGFSIDINSEYLPNALILAYRICLAILYVIIAAIYIYISFLQAGGSESWMSSNNVVFNSVLFSTITPLFFLGCGSFVLVAAGKILSAKILSKKPVFSDYYLLALCFLFLPVGVFFIQKEINKMVGKQETKKAGRRGWVIIGVSISLLGLIISTIDFDSNHWTFQLGSKTITSDTPYFDTSKYQDSNFPVLNDSLNAEIDYESALQLIRIGEHRKAMDYLGQSIKLNPDIPKYYWHRSHILFNSFNEVDSALVEISRVIELDPTLANAFRDRGFFLFVLERNQEALLDLNQAIVLDPENARAYYNRGNVKKKLGDMEGACKDWQKAKELGDDDGALLFFVECN